MTFKDIKHDDDDNDNDNVTYILILPMTYNLWGIECFYDLCERQWCYWYFGVQSSINDWILM